jgi:hypothetical protein
LEKHVEVNATVFVRISENFYAFVSKKEFFDFFEDAFAVGYHVVCTGFFEFFDEKGNVALFIVEDPHDLEDFNPYLLEAQQNSGHL